MEDDVASNTAAVLSPTHAVEFSVWVDMPNDGTSISKHESVFDRAIGRVAHTYTELGFIDQQHYSANLNAKFAELKRGPIVLSSSYDKCIEVCRRLKRSSYTVRVCLPEQNGQNFDDDDDSEYLDVTLDSAETALHLLCQELAQKDQRGSVYGSWDSKICASLVRIMQFPLPEGEARNPNSVHSNIHTFSVRAFNNFYDLERGSHGSLHRSDVLQKCLVNLMIGTNDLADEVLRMIGNFLQNRFVASSGSCGMVIIKGVLQFLPRNRNTSPGYLLKKAIEILGEAFTTYGSRRLLPLSNNPHFATKGAPAPRNGAVLSQVSIYDNALEVLACLLDHGDERVQESSVRVLLQLASSPPVALVQMENSVKMIKVLTSFWAFTNAPLSVVEGCSSESFAVPQEGSNFEATSNDNVIAAGNTVMAFIVRQVQYFGGDDISQKDRGKPKYLLCFQLIMRLLQLSDVICQRLLSFGLLHHCKTALSVCVDGEASHEGKTGGTPDKNRSKPPKAEAVDHLLSVLLLVSTVSLYGWEAVSTSPVAGVPPIMTGKPNERPEPCVVGGMLPFGIGEAVEVEARGDLAQLCVTSGSSSSKSKARQAKKSGMLLGTVDAEEWVQENNGLDDNDVDHTSSSAAAASSKALDSSDSTTTSEKGAASSEPEDAAAPCEWLLAVVLSVEYDGHCFVHIPRQSPGGGGNLPGKSSSSSRASSTTPLDKHGAAAAAGGRIVRVPIGQLRLPDRSTHDDMGRGGGGSGAEGTKAVRSFPNRLPPSRAYNRTPVITPALVMSYLREAKEKATAEAADASAAAAGASSDNAGKHPIDKKLALTHKQRMLHQRFQNSYQGSPSSRRRALDLDFIKSCIDGNVALAVKLLRSGMPPTLTIDSTSVDELMGEGDDREGDGVMEDDDGYDSNDSDIASRDEDQPGQHAIAKGGLSLDDDDDHKCDDSLGGDMALDGEGEAAATVDTNKGAQQGSSSSAAAAGTGTDGDPNRRSALQVALDTEQLPVAAAVVRSLVEARQLLRECGGLLPRKGGDDSASGSGGDAKKAAAGKKGGKSSHKLKTSAAPIFPGGLPHKDLAVGVRVYHQTFLGGRLVGWKDGGVRHHDTSGGLSFDKAVRVDFDVGGHWNVKAKDCTFLTPDHEASPASEESTFRPALVAVLESKIDGILRRALKVELERGHVESIQLFADEGVDLAALTTGPEAAGALQLRGPEKELLDSVKEVTRARRQKSDATTGDVSY
jgi:hypothetical protein